MTVTDLLDQLEAALDKENIGKARHVLDDIRVEIDKQNAWHWLRNNEPASYEELKAKLEAAQDGLAQSGRSEIGQLIKVFDRCERHGIDLAELNISEQLHKHREANAYLASTLRADLPDEQERDQLLRALKIIQGDRTRKGTRERVRSSRQRSAT